MPGIVAILTKKPRSWAEPQLRQMVDAISHHVSYKNGTWMDERSGVYVGWSVLENSPCNAMPLSNHRGSVALFFTGEDYPDRALISRSRQQNSSPAHDSMAY